MSKSQSILSCPPELLMRNVVRRQGLGGSSSPTLYSTSAAEGTYRAAVCIELGKPLEVQNLPRQPLGPGEVRLRIHNAGINFAEVLTVQGKYQDKPPVPFVPGSEVGGEVLEVAEDVKQVSVGDRCVALTFGKGAYAEEAVISAMTVFPLPKTVSYAAAASLLTTYGTAWQALTRRANIKEGETVLVTAAAGGVGLAAVELAAKVFNCKVIGACGGPAKCALVKEKGAVAAIDYNTESIKDRMKELTDGRGADIIFDAVGGKVFDQCLRSVAFEGRILVIGFASGEIPKVPANLLLLKVASVIGVYWGSTSVRHPESFMESIQSCVKVLREGKIQPHVSAAFPLAQANEALQFLADRKSTGKVVIDCLK